LFLPFEFTDLLLPTPAAATDLNERTVLYFEEEKIKRKYEWNLTASSQ